MTQAYNLSQFANRLNTSGQINPSGLLSSVLPINQGGTNNASLAVTAGGVIYTDGSKLVNVGIGTTNQYLMSNGSGAPSWNTPTSGFTAMQVYTTGSGTWTIPTGVAACKITVVGGGGNGGNAQGSSGTSADAGGGGGGGGGASIRYYTGLTSGNTISYTVGGVAGTSSVSSGTQTITTISATGGANGTNSNTQTTAAGGAGGTGSGGNINFSGCVGGIGTSAQNTSMGGGGGGSLLGSGGSPVYSGVASGTGANINGTPGSGYGGGASGAVANTSTATGGSGTAGVVIIEY